MVVSNNTTCDICHGKVPLWRCSSENNRKEDVWVTFHSGFGGKNLLNHVHEGRDGWVQVNPLKAVWNYVRWHIASS